MDGSFPSDFSQADPGMASGPSQYYLDWLGHFVGDRFGAALLASFFGVTRSGPVSELSQQRTF